VCDDDRQKLDGAARERGAAARAGGVTVDGGERWGRLRQRREDGVGAEGELVGMGESDDGVLPAGRGATEAAGRRVGERGVQRRDAGHVGRRQVGDGGLLHRAGVGSSTPSGTSVSSGIPGVWSLGCGWVWLLDARGEWGRCCDVVSVVMS
jgi:hypothetical protein